MDLYYPMPYKHTEPRFIICRANHVLSYDVCEHTKQYIFKSVQLLLKERELLLFLVNPNPNHNPNPKPNPIPNRQHFS